MATTTTWRRLNATRDHRWAQPRLSAYLEGELPDRAERRLAAHEEICPECAHLIRTLQALLVALPALRLPPETGFAIAERTADQVRARIDEWD
jgi:anti-sigma factor RsiW